VLVEILPDFLEHSQESGVCGIATVNAQIAERQNVLSDLKCSTAKSTGLSQRLLNWVRFVKILSALLALHLVRSSTPSDRRVAAAFVFYIYTLHAPPVALEHTLRLLA
jgi:hypothetical protein